MGGLDCFIYGGDFHGEEREVGIVRLDEDEALLVL